MSLVNQSLIKEVSDGNSSGTRVGQSATDLVGFHGATPTAQIAVLTLATAATLATSTAAIQTLLAALKTKGLMASS